MADLFTYSLSDFILFSPNTYARMFARYQDAIQPMPWLGLVGGIIVLFVVWQRHRMIWAVVLLATAWVWTGWAFHMDRYAELSWAAFYFGLAFVAQGLLTILLGFSMRADGARTTAMVLVGFALFGHPLINLLSGHAWPSTGLFGTAPDPTAVAALGFSLVTRGWRRWAVGAVPALWCLIAVATAYGLGHPELGISAGAGLLYWVTVSVWPRRPAALG